MSYLSELPPVVLLLMGLGLGTLLSALVALLWKATYTRHIRRDAVLRSQAVIAGQVHEQLLPYLPGFEFNPKDARFLGSPVDLIVFDGLDAGALRSVVFVEVKTGNAGLTQRERLVRDAILGGRVRWEEVRK